MSIAQTAPQRIASLVLLSLAFAPAATFAQEKPVDDAAITAEIGKLRETPDTERGAKIGAIAMEIRSLPAGNRKVALADALAHMATEGDPGTDNLQAVTTTLAQALKEKPQKGKGDTPARPYLDVARLVRYESMTADLDHPQYTKAMANLAAIDDEVGKLDFTLSTLDGRKKVTLSELHGKIVLVNFWATWCPPCRKELPSLEAIARHYSDQLVVLSLTDEQIYKVGTFLGGSKFTMNMLTDTDGNVAKKFHVDGIPRSFVFDKDGKLVTQSLDMRTQRQFLTMLAKAGLKPTKAS